MEFSYRLVLFFCNIAEFCVACQQSGYPWCCFIRLIDVKLFGEKNQVCKIMWPDEYLKFRFDYYGGNHIPSIFHRTQLACTFVHSPQDNQPENVLFSDVFYRIVPSISK